MRAQQYDKARYPAQRGLTIVELMIALTLGMIVVAAVTALLLSSRTGYATQDDVTRLQDGGRFALEQIARAVRQAAYENWDSEQAPILLQPEFGPNIAGFDARRLNSTSTALDNPLTSAVNGSDVLAVRFFGSGTGAGGDGTILNCAGFGVPAPMSPANADADRGWSIFYVANAANGIPELRCKYFGKAAWTSDAIVSGVESFQVLYGLDTTGDGIADTFVTASAINALDDALVLSGADAAAKARDRNRKTYWKKITAVKVALLLRGGPANGAVASNAQYDLFGPDYGDANGATDIGTRIKESDLPASQRNRLRRVFGTTIELRNRAAGGGA